MDAGSYISCFFEGSAREFSSVAGWKFCPSFPPTTKYFCILKVHWPSSPPPHIQAKPCSVQSGQPCFYSRFGMPLDNSNIGSLASYISLQSVRRGRFAGIYRTFRMWILLKDPSKCLTVEKNKETQHGRILLIPYFGTKLFLLHDTELGFNPATVQYGLWYRWQSWRKQ